MSNFLLKLSNLVAIIVPCGSEYYVNYALREVLSFVFSNFSAHQHKWVPSNSGVRGEEEKVFSILFSLSHHGQIFIGLYHIPPPSKQVVLIHLN